MAIDLSAFDRLASALQAYAGLALPREHLPFVEARLLPVVRRLEMKSSEILIERVASRGEPHLLQAAFEALAPSETSFFRDKAPFELLKREVLPELAAGRGDGKLRIWCAGCSTGQEVYSIAMAIQAMAGETPLDVEILGSDLSERCLEKAQAGYYTQFEVQRGLPIRLLLDWFDPSEEMWRVSPRLRQVVRWRTFNLMDDPAPLGRFDVILCRNVMSSLNPDARKDVLERLAGVLANDGRLVLGLSETVHGLTEAFRPVAGRRGLYAPGRPSARRVA